MPRSNALKWRRWIKLRSGRYIKYGKGGYPKTYTSSRARTGKGMKVLPSMNSLLHTPLLPLSKYARLPYYDSNSLTAPANGLSTAYVFTANGLYDPNISGVGHQPMGFDQLMLFYEHYCVLSAKITVNFYNVDIDDHCVVGILIAPDATIETSPSKLNENGMLVKKFAEPNTSGSSHTSATVSVNLGKVNGKKDVTAEDDMRGDIASNPTEQTYIHIFVYNITSANTVVIPFECTIEYTAKFTEPRKMIQS